MAAIFFFIITHEEPPSFNQDFHSCYIWDSERGEAADMDCFFFFTLSGFTGRSGKLGRHRDARIEILLHIVSRPRDQESRYEP
jgi:hypothetical protein